MAVLLLDFGSRLLARESVRHFLREVGVIVASEGLVEVVMRVTEGF